MELEPENLSRFPLTSIAAIADFVRVAYVGWIGEESGCPRSY